MTGKEREAKVEGERSEAWPGVCVAERWWIGVTKGQLLTQGLWVNSRVSLELQNCLRDFVLMASVHFGRLQMMKSINSRGRERVWLRALT